MKELMKMAIGMTNTPQAADLGYGARLFLAADKLHCNIGSIECKHVVFVLVFLGYISVAFSTVFEKL